MRETSGYKLLACSLDGQYVGLAGYRIDHSFYSGKSLYVYDLVVKEANREQQIGSRLFKQLEKVGLKHGCASIHLESGKWGKKQTMKELIIEFLGVHRFRAHKFYMDKGMHISCYHFEKKLSI